MPFAGIHGQPSGPKKGVQVEEAVFLALYPLSYGPLNSARPDSNRRPLPPKGFVCFIRRGTPRFFQIQPNVASGRTVMFPLS
jgi:hypothetical protein